VPARDIAGWIDQTLLRPGATAGDIDRLCDEARVHRFAAVCVNPVWVARCAARLAGCGVGVAAVVGFPLGANVPSVKAAEATQAVGDGATELDMVAALGHLRAGDWRWVQADIELVVRAAGVPVKVIIESAALAPDEIVRASVIARDAGARFVKTSTGFHPAGGATIEAVELIRRTVGDGMGVKASGGIRDCATALRLLAAGATRLGTSSGVRIASCLGREPMPRAANELHALAERHVAVCMA
jgi:deoxyribose-phosphate aldolase